MAFALYTFDLGMGHDWKENFYFKLNKVLQERNNISMEKWKGFLFYFFSGLKKIKNLEVIVYR